ANTGASVLWVIAGALVLAVIGAVLVLRSRRRNND
ncbi:MAG: LPXTG cell wall anchor domain-containing protein, partial [Corynebacterium matruchotii]